MPWVFQAKRNESLGRAGKKQLKNPGVWKEFLIEILLTGVGRSRGMIEIKNHESQTCGGQFGYGTYIAWYRRVRVRLNSRDR